MMTILTESQKKHELSLLGNKWRIEEDKLIREYSFKDFLETVDFINKLKDYFEKVAHHPDICIRYNKALFSLSTHDVGGLTSLDFVVATEIHKMYLKEKQ